MNVPQTLAKLRGDSYQSYAWPRQLGVLFERNGLSVSLVAAVSVAVFVVAFIALRDPAVLFAPHTGPGAFYRVMPHEVMGGFSSRSRSMRDSLPS